jgi:hypothetical protein
VDGEAAVEITSHADRKRGHFLESLRRHISIYFLRTESLRRRRRRRRRRR